MYQFIAAKFTKRITNVSTVSVAIILQCMKLLKLAVRTEGERGKAADPGAKRIQHSQKNNQAGTVEREAKIPELQKVTMSKLKEPKDSHVGQATIWHCETCYDVRFRDIVSV